MSAFDARTGNDVTIVTKVSVAIHDASYRYASVTVSQPLAADVDKAGMYCLALTPSHAGHLLMGRSDVDRWIRWCRLPARRDQLGHHTVAGYVAARERGELTPGRARGG
jgi:hypothetical protein